MGTRSHIEDASLDRFRDFHPPGRKMRFGARDQPQTTSRRSHVRKSVMFACVLVLGSAGASGAKPLDLPGMAYIDGLPCNSLAFLWPGRIVCRRRPSWVGGSLSCPGTRIREARSGLRQPRVANVKQVRPGSIGRREQGRDHGLQRMRRPFSKRPNNIADCIAKLLRCQLQLQNDDTPTGCGCYGGGDAYDVQRSRRGAESKSYQRFRSPGSRAPADAQPPRCRQTARIF